MTATREASAQELELLWEAVADGDYVEDASDGRLQWAFLIDYRRQGGGVLFPGLTGAIVYAENEVGPTAAWFYASRADLSDAWRETFTSTSTSTAAARGAR